MNLNNLIAKGKYNSVYRDGNLAIKLFNEDYPKELVLNEALITAKVERTGLHVPVIHEVTSIDGKWALVMDYVQGKTFGEMITKKPEKVDEYMNMFVDIQMDIHAKDGSSLDSLQDKIYKRINDSDEIYKEVKYELLTRLDSAPKHKKLCHGDFSTTNVVIPDNGDEPYIIDWNHATYGNASADAARSFLWITMYKPEAAEEYLDIFCSKTGTDKIYVKRWLPVVAASRLYYNIPEEKDLINRFIAEVSDEI